MRPARARGATGVTLLEVLVAMGIVVLVLVILWDLFISSRRGMVRGEAKLDYVADSSMAYAVLQRDLHACLEPPEIVADSVLRIRRCAVSRASSAVTSQVVSYTRVEGMRPADAMVVRKVESGLLPGEERERAFCRGNVRDFRVTAREVAGIKAVEIGFTFRAITDAGETRFSRILLPRNADTDRTWRPIGP